MPGKSAVWLPGLYKSLLGRSSSPAPRRLGNGPGLNRFSEWGDPRSQRCGDSGRDHRFAERRDLGSAPIRLQQLRRVCHSRHHARPLYIQASAQGFNPQKVAEFVLAVDQIATFDFSLALGSQNEVVTVDATAAQLNVTSAGLGTVIETKQVNELPLNGRNFTALLALTPGVVPIMVGQSNGMSGNGGFGAAVAIGSDYSFPAINGQTNRSDFFLMDGLYNYGAIESTYAVAPIIDAIQEFKVVSHTDNAEYGSVLGGVVNVVTKSGTNDLHGSGWEYVRNTVFDARNYFLPPSQSKPPFIRTSLAARWAVRS